MSGQPAVSIAIRAFRRRWLGEAIASVLAQTHRDLELVVYDDAGDLEDVAAGFRDARLRYHPARERLGAAGRYGAAVALCRGGYVGLLDDDDRYEPEFVERLVAALEADPGAGAAVAGFLWEHDGDLVAPPADGRVPGAQPDALRAFLELRWIPTPSCVLLRRAALDEDETRRPMPDGVAPDLFVNVRAAEAGRRFVLVGESLVVKRWHAGQVSRDGLGAHDRVAESWRRLPLSDPELDAVRRAQLARSLVRRAGHRVLFDRDGARARADLREARIADAREWRIRRTAVAAAAMLPRLGALALRAWLARPQARRRRELPPGMRLPDGDRRVGSG